MDGFLFTISIQIYHKKFSKSQKKKCQVPFRTQTRAAVKWPAENGLQACSNSKAFNSQYLPTPPSTFKAGLLAQNSTKSIMAKSRKLKARRPQVPALK